jgi:hypothetical protein
MGIMSCNKAEVTSGFQDYRLSSDIAASLKVPQINYPGNMVPVEVVTACLDGSIDSRHLENFQIVDGAVALADVLQYLGTSMDSSKVFYDNGRAVLRTATRQRAQRLPWPVPQAL